MSKQQVNNKELQAQDTTVMLEKYIEDELIESEMDKCKEDDQYVSEYEYDESDTSISSDAMTDYMRQIGSIKIMTPEEEVACFKRFENGDREAYDEIFNHNLKLVVSIAKKYFLVATNMEPLDVVMEGNIGLMTAIRRFDYRRGYKFSTYASWWIKQTITRAIYNNNNMIRIPIHANEGLHRYRKLMEELAKTGEAEPAVREIAKAINVTEEQVLIFRNIVNGMANPSSLNKLANQEEDAETEIQDLVSSDMNIETEYMNQDLRETLFEILDQWITKYPGKNKERQRQIIIRRFGLETGSPETLEMIGADYGITRERVRQIELKFIRYARLPKNKRVLKEYIE